MEDRPRSVMGWVAWRRKAASLLRGQAHPITVITSAYNERFLAPFFFRHYAFAERIILLLDSDTTDGTEEVARGFGNVEIRSLTYPDGFDDDIKVAALNGAYAELRRGYALLVDMDEFAFLEHSRYLQYDLSHVELWNVYRHRTEGDLNADLPVKEQRRHGMLDTIYRKPVLARAGLPLRWHPGNHAVTLPPASPEQGHLVIQNEWVDSAALGVNPEPYLGAHWAKADASFCVERQVANRRDRLSRNNREKGYTFQYFHITEEGVIRDCRSHEEDPRAW